MATVTASVAPFLLLLFRVSAIGCSASADTADIGLTSAWITESPESGIAVRSKPYTLQCHSTLPNVSYKWMFNNRTLDLVKDPRRQILSSGSLFFKTVMNKKSGDAGQYRCIIQTPNGAASSKTVTLQIAAMHDFDKSPENVTVSSEASHFVVRLTCHIDSVPEALITWEKDKTTVLYDNERYITKVPGVLYIKNVNEKDAGQYRCVAKNLLMNKTKFSEFGHLKVGPISVAGSQSDIQPLAFISPTSQYSSVKYMTEGENVTFECAATGFPPPQLNWSLTTFTGNKQDSTLNTDKTSVNILSLKSVSINDSGTYTCHASQSVTGWPDFPHAQVFQLEVMTPPVITVRPETITMPIANSIRFKCKTEGDPTPITSWYHNGQPLKFHGRIKIKDDQLLVSNTVSSDAGVYQCFASNEFGVTWAGALYIISSSPYEPAPPININCRTLSSTQIQVSWRKSPTDTPDDPPIMIHDESMQLVPSHSRGLMPSGSSDTGNKIRRAYTIHYVPSDGGEEEQKVSVNHSIIIEKLKPYKNYTFYVRVYNGKSASDQSEKVTCKTQDGAPQTVPELTVNPLNPVSLHAEWSAINGHLASGTVTQYHILWRRFRSVSYYVHVLHKNVKQYTMTGLKPGGQYEVQVLGATQNGLPNIDFTWYFIELPPVNPTIPVPVLTYSSTQSSIRLSWSVPEDSTSQFDSFRLMYRVTSQTNQSSMTLHTFGPDTNNYLIDNSSEMDVYEVILNCVSEMSGEGEPVSTVISVGGDLLIPPFQIEAVATSLHTLNLSWVPPDSIDLSSSLFIIVYSPVANSTHNSTTVFTDESVTSYELTGLKPYCLYEIKISVQDKNNRKSEFSQKIHIRTLQGVPGIVEQIEWRWINASSVRISWAEPIKSNGVIVGYHISYTDELHVPPTSWAQLNVSRNKNSIELLSLSNNTQYFFMVRASTDAGFGPQSGIFCIEPYSIPLIDSSANSKQPAGPPPLLEDEQLLGIVIGCVIGVCCIIICTTSIVLKRQCMKAERVQDPQLGTLGNDVTYCAQHIRPFTVEHVQHEEIVPLNDVSFIARHMDGRDRYSNNMSGMALLPLLDHSNVGDNDITNVHIIENPQCTVSVDGYDVDSLLSESAEGGGGTEESGCSDQMAKSHKGGDCSVVDDGFHEHIEHNKILVR